jgi:hypothetical protein
MIASTTSSVAVPQRPSWRTGRPVARALVHLVQLSHALVVEPLHGHFPLAVVVVYPQAIGRLAHVALRATHHYETQVTLKAAGCGRPPGRLGSTRLAGTAEAYLILQQGFLVSVGPSCSDGPP